MLTPAETRDRLRSRPLVYVADLDHPELDEDDHHHLARSLRVGPGAPITVADGAGRWRSARFGSRPEPDGPIEETERPVPLLTVGFVPVKGERSETVVQKLTELGIDRIVPVLSERSVVRWDAKRAERNHDRHRRIVREASMQSRRVHLPEVLGLVESLERFEAAHGRFSVAEPGGGTIDATVATIVIGPEGGFAPSEVAGRPAVGLPGGILRAETACYAAATLMASVRSGVGA